MRLFYGIFYYFFTKISTAVNLKLQHSKITLGSPHNQPKTVLEPTQDHPRFKPGPPQANLRPTSELP